MKKFTALILTLILVFTLAACGGKDGSTAPATPTEAPEFTIGTTDGQTYENTFAGLGITFPDGWIFATEEEIAQLNNMTLDMMGDDYREMLENSNIVYAMSASNGGNNVNINFENISAYKSQVPSPEAYRDLGMEQCESMFEEMGCEVVQLDATEVQIDGTSYAGMTTAVSYLGQQISQTGFYFFCGDYVCCVTISAQTPEQCQEIVDCFYHLN